MSRMNVKENLIVKEVGRIFKTFTLLYLKICTGSVDEAKTTQ